MDAIEGKVWRCDLTREMKLVSKRPVNSPESLAAAAAASITWPASACSYVAGRGLRECGLTKGVAKLKRRRAK